MVVFAARPVFRRSRTDHGAAEASEKDIAAMPAYLGWIVVDRAVGRFVVRASRRLRAVGRLPPSRARPRGERYPATLELGGLAV